jgi:superfamily II DNA or RNA helicase
MIDSKQWLKNQLEDRRKRLNSIDLSTELESDLPLTDFQRRAARRGCLTLGRFGGLLLADDVGLGKTRTALHIAEAFGRRQRDNDTGDVPTVAYIVPARLREHWRRRLDSKADHQFHITTHHQLSHQQFADLPNSPDLVIIDEAHRFCNPKTNRYRALRRLPGTPLLLVTATPIRNSPRNLYHLLRLFLSERDTLPFGGRRLSSIFESDSPKRLMTSLAPFIIRRTRTETERSSLSIPEPEFNILRYRAGEAEEWLWTNLSDHIDAIELENAPRWSTGLFARYMQRRWESSPKALKKSVESLLMYNHLWLQARRQGRTLNRDLFQSLSGSHTQYILPFVCPTGSEEIEESSDTVDAVRRDTEKLQTLQKNLEKADCNTRSREVLDWVKSLDEKVLIISEYRETVESIFRALNREAPATKAGLITGSRALATGLSQTTERDVIERFRHQPDTARATDDIRILCGTDCLSTGKNLQVARHLVIMDLPESPLTLRQRIGRIARPNSPFDKVHVHLPRPDTWSDPLGLLQQLKSKTRQAQESGIDLFPNSEDSQKMPWQESSRHDSIPHFNLETRLDDIGLQNLPSKPTADRQNPPDMLTASNDPDRALARFTVRSDNETAELWRLFNSTGELLAGDKVIETLKRLRHAPTPLETVSDEHSGPVRAVFNYLSELRAALLAPRIPPKNIAAESRQLDLKTRRKIRRSNTRREELNLRASQQVTERDATEQISKEREQSFTPESINLEAVVLI